MSSIVSIGAAGMQSAASRFEAAASQVVRAVPVIEPDEPRLIDLPTAMVTMSLASYDYKAAAKVAVIGRDIMQAALDMIA